MIFAFFPGFLLFLKIDLVDFFYFEDVGLSIMIL